MLNKEIIEKLFDTSYMERWNDKLRPMPLIEIDKQAHKTIIAWFIAKHEELEKSIQWSILIEKIIFELLQRIILTDIKPSIINKIKSDKDKYKELIDWTVDKLDFFFNEYDLTDKYTAHFLSNSKTPHDHCRR